MDLFNHRPRNERYIQVKFNNNSKIKLIFNQIKKKRFYFLFNCGCVFSERAYKTISSSNLKCIKCDRPYKDIDLIVINPNDDDFELNKQKQKQRKEEIAKAV
jgi:hypothetical protein